MNTHRLKCVPPFFAAIRDGSKPFEVRRNDRDYQVGDVLVLAEWTFLPGTESFGFTGQEEARRVSYVLTEFPGLEAGHVVLGFELAIATFPTHDHRAFIAAVAAETARRHAHRTLDSARGKDPEDRFAAISRALGFALVAAMVGNVSRMRQQLVTAAASMADWHAFGGGVREPFS